LCQFSNSSIFNEVAAQIHNLKMGVALNQSCYIDGSNVPDAIGA
jgi:hypothetical protein